MKSIMSLNKRELYSIIQICHASVGILMECPEGRHSIRIPTLPWHICFIILNKPQFGKISIKTTMTAGRSSENSGCFAGGHFAGGHDGMANLCKPITAYDFHVRYNNTECHRICVLYVSLFPPGLAIRGLTILVISF